MAEALAEAGIELADIAPQSLDRSQKLDSPKISLHYAARDDHETVLDQWINILRPDPSKLNKRDSIGYTPLHYAAKFNRYSALVKLVEAGADPNLSTKEENFTSLHFAALYTDDKSTNTSTLTTNEKIVQYLVNLKGNKIKLNARDQYGLSALHLACQRGNKTAVEILLRCSDVDVHIEDANKDTPLHEACLNGYHDIVEALLTHMETLGKLDYGPQNSESQTPLHLASREGHVETVKTLFKHVGDYKKRVALVAVRDNERNTALHLACKSGKEEIVNILLINGADLFAEKHDHITPMHISARYGFVGVARTLLSSGEDLIDIVDAYNQTPLHYAAKYNQIEMLNFLIDNGADVMATDTESYTPLMLAAREGHLNVFDVLLRRGSPIHKSVLHIAAEENHMQILQSALKNEKGFELVNSTDANYNTSLHLAASNGNIESVEVLLQLASTRIKVEARNELNKTPMLLAASNGHLSVVEVLLQHQKDCILDEDEDGNSPLHLACLNGFHRIVKLLLDFHADYHAKNASLWTAIDCAAANGHEKALKVLLEAGAEVNPVDTTKPPLHLAAQEGHLGVVILLLEHKADVGNCVNDLNVLDVAIDNNHEDVALCIIQSDQWKTALRHTTISSRGKISTPLRKLIKKMPNVAREVFNRCSEGNNTKDGKIQPDSRDYNVKFDYEFLEDFRDEEENVCKRYFRRLTGSARTGGYVADFGSADTLSVKSYASKTNDESKILLPPLKTPKSSKHGFSTDWGPVGFKKKLHPLSLMVAYNRTDLLKHPLVTSLLKLKWRTYGRYFYFSNLLVYIVFVVFITAFALVSLNPQSATCTAVFDESFGSMSSDMIIYNNSLNGCFSLPSQTVGNSLDNSLVTGTEVCNNNTLQIMCGEISDANCGQCGLSSVNRVFLYASASIVIAVAALRFLLELLQLFASKLNYIFDWVNWMEVILFVCAIAFCFVYFTDCLCPTEWQWQLGCIAVFLTWIDLIIFIQKLPLTGIYVLMFVHIFYTFCKMIILTALLILAFSIAFYMTFFDPKAEFMRSSFATPGRAILKTMTMTTGEFEYDSIFRQFPGGAEEGSILEEVPFPPVSFILWIIFLVLMPILLTNLLVGLAVDDIKGIQDAAVLRRLALQVDLALSIEEKFPTRLRRFVIRGAYTVVPNRKLGIREKIRYLALGTENSRYDSLENISNALHPQLTPIEQVQTQTHNLTLEMKKMNEVIHELRVKKGRSSEHSHTPTESLMADIKKMNSEISQLAKRSVLMEKLILEIAKKQKISVTEESRSYI